MQAALVDDLKSRTHWSYPADSCRSFAAQQLAGDVDVFAAGGLRLVQRGVAMLSPVRTLDSLISIGRFMPAITSVRPDSITDMARLDGVPPNMSVRMMTPVPVSARCDRLDDVLAPLLHVVVGADRHGLELVLGSDDMLDGMPELFGQLTVRDKHESDHSMVAPVMAAFRRTSDCASGGPGRQERYLVDHRIVDKPNLAVRVCDFAAF